MFFNLQHARKRNEIRKELNNRKAHLETKMRFVALCHIAVFRNGTWDFIAIRQSFRYNEHWLDDQVTILIQFV